MSLFTRSKGVGIIFCTVLLLFSLFINANKPLKAEDSGWTSDQPLSFTTLEQIPSADDLPTTALGSISCSNRTIKLLPARPLVYPPYIQAEKTQSSCVTETAYGSISTHGGLQRPGSSLYGSVKTSNGRYVSLIPIPRSNIALYSPSGNMKGSILALIPQASSRLSSSTIYTGEVTHTINIDGQRVIKDASNNSIFFKTSSLSFTPDGEWMVADSPTHGVVRINTNTLDILKIGPYFNHNAAYGVNLQTSITADGRYVALASNGHTHFKVYDLNTCDKQEQNPCKHTDLILPIKEAYSEYTSVNKLRFLNTDTLQVYVTTGASTTQKIYRTLISPNGSTSDDTYDYLGLGDSFTSGEGAFNYKAFTDTDENKCHNSLVAYPFLIGSEIGFIDYESVACSGAITFDIRAEKRIYTSDPQAKHKNGDPYDQEIEQNFLPGYRPQLFFTGRKTPEIITLGIGGNNIGFGDIVKNCVMPGTCYNSYAERKMLLQTVDNEFDELVATYTEVAESSPESRIYVHGYPSIVAEAGDCNGNVRLNENERKLANGLVNYLNETIERAAAKAGVYYVDVEDAFTGYRLCEQRWQWELAVNGLTAGDEKLIDDKWILNWFNGPIGNESYHPNARGHELYKSSILSRTDNLTAPMPTANHSVQAVNDHSNEKVFGGYEPSPVWRDSYYQDGMASDSWFVHDEYNITVPADTMNFQPESDVEVWVHSTPVQVGTFRASSVGEFSAEINVPEIEPGYHTLHVLGTNSSGEMVDIYDHIYVGHSRNDFDGDGIQNQDEICLFGDPIGIDMDQDGIDDACDGFISQPPAVETNVNGNNVLGDSDENTSNTPSEDRPPTTEKLTNNESSLLLAAATGTDASDNENNDASISPSNTTRVLGEQSGEKETQGQGLVGSIKDDKQPYIVLATILVAGTAGGWLFFRKS